jgi:hypothetical protein
VVAGIPEGQTVAMARPDKQGDAKGGDKKAPSAVKAISQ